MIDQCIYEVYQRDKKVFIPDFGAIIYSEFNDDINFNEHLTFDDGKVVAEIQKKDFMSEEEARKVLDEYVQEIKNSLGQGKLHFFGGIGYLSKDENGSFFLQKSKSEKMESAPENDVPSAENSPFDPIEEYTPFELTKEEESSPPWSEAYSDDSGYAAEDNFSDSEETYTSTAPEEQEAMGAVYHEHKKQNSLKTVFWIMIPVLLLAAGAYYYFNFYQEGDHQSLPETISEALGYKEASTSSEEVGTEADNSSSVKEDSQLAQTTSSDTHIIDTPDETDNESKTYCLVFGSFKVERNADRYEQRLLSRGIDVKKFKGKDNFYFVGVDQIKGKTKAVKILTETRQKYPDAWIINRALIKI